MSLSKSKCWYSNNCLQFLKHGALLRCFFLPCLYSSFSPFSLPTFANIFITQKFENNIHDRDLCCQLSAEIDSIPWRSESENKVLKINLRVNCLLSKGKKSLSQQVMLMSHCQHFTFKSGRRFWVSLSRPSSGWPDWAIFRQLGYF
jgi:hypothetical protein